MRVGALMAGRRPRFRARRDHGSGSVTKAPTRSRSPSGRIARRRCTMPCRSFFAGFGQSNLGP